MYTEKYRLQLHYSVPTGWANDPNGLIYVNGYYHLFYQHNPVSTTFGSMYWGHARSKDLIHWENLPMALKPYKKGDIYSGCCVLDKDNVTGLIPSTKTKTTTATTFENESNVAIIAIYTLHKDDSQTQAMAYSLDNGITWKQYDENPIIPNPGKPDFRDPNIFERFGKYYMTLAVGNHISFYVSTDLKVWIWTSDFGVDPDEGDKSGVWECPSLFQLKDEHGIEHDVLLVSENGVKNGSQLQYFIGKFNGDRFESNGQSSVLWAENGFDNYATIPFSNDPYDRIVVIGWLNNWLYGQQIPTTVWRGQMTIPRELALQTIDGNIHLIQRPIKELNDLIDPLKQWSLSTPLQINGNQIIDLTQQIPFKTGSMITLDYAFDIESNPYGKIGIRFGNNLGEFVTFHLNINEKMYEVDRRSSGNVSFNSRFADRVACAKRISRNNLVSGRIILDTASIEIFADNGLNTFSALFFPMKLFENIQLVSAIEIDDGKSVIVEKLDIAVLNSIWNEDIN